MSNSEDPREGESQGARQTGRPQKRYRESFGAATLHTTTTYIPEPFSVFLGTTPAWSLCVFCRSFSR